MRQITVLSCVLVAAWCAEIPSSHKKCSRKDANFNSCLLDAVNDALAKSIKPVKEINLASLSPLEIPELKISAGRGAVGFDQNYKDMKVSGIPDFRCSKIDMDFEKQRLYLNGSSPLMQLDFNYEINGRILVLPIKGNGPGSIKLENIIIEATFELEEFEKKGKKHYKVTKSTLNLIPQHIVFHLDNLFDGDKALGDNINQVLNENWREVFKDVEEGYDNAFGQIFGAIFNNVLAKVSIDEMFG